MAQSGICRISEAVSGSLADARAESGARGLAVVFSGGKDAGAGPSSGDCRRDGEGDPHHLGAQAGHATTRCDLRRRLSEHLTGLAAATACRGPWRLIYYEAY